MAAHIVTRGLMGVSLTATSRSRQATGFIAPMMRAVRRPWATSTAVFSRRSRSYARNASSTFPVLAERSPERHRVDHRLRCALAGVRQHRVGRVPEKRDDALAPERQRVAIEELVDAHVGGA